MEYELYHHGIKGQKWGIRRYQKKDGTLTPAGKKRYYDTPELNKQKDEMKSAKTAYQESKRSYNSASNKYQNVPTTKNFEAMKTARSKFLVDRLAYRRAKLKYDTNKEAARIEDKGVEFKKKSKHRLELEDQYKKLGMTDEQAQAAANKRIRTEKILIASAALSVAACATYVAVKARKNRIDGVIKAGESLQRIEMQDTGGKLHDVFYVAHDEKDKRRYANLLGFTRQQQTGHAYMMKLSAERDVRVASMDRCRKTFHELYSSDPDFKAAVEKHVPGIGALGKKKRYDMYNKALVGMHDSDASKKFYARLRAAGYGAIQDVNDMKFSGYHAKNPLIVFDNKAGSIMVRSVREMTEDLSKSGTKELMRATGETLAEDFLKKAGPLSAAALTGTAVATYTADANKQYNTQGGTSKWS